MRLQPQSYRTGKDCHSITAGSILNSNCVLTSFRAFPQTAAEIADKVRRLPGVSDVLIPQDLDYPGIQLDINREMAGRMGVSSSNLCCSADGAGFATGNT